MFNGIFIVVNYTNLLLKRPVKVFIFALLRSIFSQFVNKLKNIRTNKFLIKM